MQSKENEILVTHTLFISKENEKALQDAGFRIRRLENSKVSEEELCREIKGKVGYILGGIEEVTPKVIGSADKLRAIAFTGTDYKHYITAWQQCMAKGIKITSVPGANAAAVAEYTITLILATVRRIFDLGRTGTTRFKTTKGLNELVVGVVGLGNVGKNVGKLVAHLIKGMGAKDILYHSRTRDHATERELGIKYVSLQELLKRSDIVTFHVPTSVGRNFIGARELGMMKDNSIIINTAFAKLVDFEALHREIKSGRLLAAFDEPPEGEYSDLPVGRFFCSNVATAYNTESAITTVSNMATSSIINVLKTGKDAHLVTSKEQ